MMYPRPEATGTKCTPHIGVKARNEIVGSQAPYLQALHLQNRGNQDIGSPFVRQFHSVKRMGRLSCYRLRRSRSAYCCEIKKCPAGKISSMTYRSGSSPNFLSPNCISCSLNSS